MTTQNLLERTGDPFALDAAEFPFSDALIIQTIASPVHLHWEAGGGGFFVEIEEAPLEHFEAATLLTGSGKRVPGFAAGTFLFFPIAYRLRWETGEPGHRMPVTGYVAGARSRTTVLAILASGRWVKLTAGGLASQSLSGAFRDHRFAQARLQRQPFATALSGFSGEARPIKSTLVTPFQFVTLADETCPIELGWQIRERWEEVLAWRGPVNGHPSNSLPPSLPGTNGSHARVPLVYGNGEPVSDNRREYAAFQQYRQVAGSLPSDRDALRFWYLEQRREIMT